MSLDLDPIKARAEAATPGPWAVPAANVFRVIAPEAENNNPPQGRTPPYPWRVVCDAASWDGEAADITFIAHARADVPALVAEVERLRAENEALVDAYDTLKSDADAAVGRLTDKLYRVDL